jgi:hypothetical protein
LPHRPGPSEEREAETMLADVVSEPGFYISRFVKAVLK